MIRPQQFRGSQLSCQKRSRGVSESNEAARRPDPDAVRSPRADLVGLGDGQLAWGTRADGRVSRRRENG